MKKSFVTLSTVILILLIAISSHPQVVFADGETPTPEETTNVEETPPPEETDQTDGVDPTSIADATPEGGEEKETEPTSTPESGETAPTQTETPEADAEIPDQDKIAPEQTDTPAEISTSSVSEVLEQAPEGTQLVVLDSEGQMEPLASQEAADIVLNGDPMWCPSGILPGDISCSSSYNSFENLLVDLGSYSGDGTIFVAHDYDSSLETDDITIDGNVYTNLGALTIQGGWDGTVGSGNVIGSSTFNGVSLEIINWGGQVTVNNVIIIAANDGLEIKTSGAVTLNNVEINDIVYSDGINIDAGENVSISNVTSSSNKYSGADIISSGSASIQRSEFNNNGSNGLSVDANGPITLNTVTASSNILYGSILETRDDVAVTNSIFNENTGGSYNAGLEITTPGNVTLSSVTASKNGGGGVITYDSTDVILQNVILQNNGWNGAYIEADCATVQTQGGIYSGNGSYGMQISTGRTHLNDTTFFNNSSGNISRDTGDCSPVPLINTLNFSTPGIRFPWHIVTLKHDTQNYLDCSYYIGTILVLENGDQIKLPCPLQDTGKLSHISNEQLPASLPDGYTYISGAESGVIRNGALQDTVEAAITVSFKRLDSPSKPVILYWDSTQWQDLASFGYQGGSIIFGSDQVLFWDRNDWSDVAPTDKKTVVLAGYENPNGYFEAVINFTGIFVYAEKVN